MDQNIIVNESSKNLRTLGRNALKGKWGLAALATLLYYVLIFVPIMIIAAIFDIESDFTSFIVCLYLFLVMGPLYLGGATFVLSVFRKKDTSVSEIFYGFERFGKATGLYIVSSIFIMLWFFALVIPAYIAAIRYSMSFFILADNQNIGVMEAIRESKRLMKGNKWKFFCLYLSFFGWMLLGSLTIVGNLFVMPYMYVTFVAFYDIANGSLRSVRTIEGETTVRSDDERTIEDPITMYKEEPGNKE